MRAGSKRLEASFGLDLHNFYRPVGDDDSPIALAFLDVEGLRGKRLHIAMRIDVSKRMFLDYPSDPLAAAKMRILAPRVAEEIAEEMRRRRLKGA